MASNKPKTPVSPEFISDIRNIANVMHMLPREILQLPHIGI